VTSNTVVVDLNAASNVGAVLGLTIDPVPVPSVSIEMYIAYAVDNSAPFNGRIARAVSTDGGATFTTDETFATGLAHSSFNHQTNGLDFGNDGCLYIAQGNNSNAGYDSDYAESRLSSGLLRACFKADDDSVDPAFDRVCGDSNTQEACGVEVYASGLRNPYDLAWHSNGMLYNTDNDANPGFRDNCGAEANAFSCGCQAPTVTPQGDELNLIEAGAYYGSPNPYLANPSGLQCNGGTDGGDACSIDADCAGGGLCVDLSALCTDASCGDSAQCHYFGEGEPPLPGEDPNGIYRAPIAQVPALLDGLVEFRDQHDGRSSSAFCSDWNGDLIATGGPGALRRFSLSADGQSATDEGNTNPAGLDTVVGRDGTIYAADYSNGKVTYATPIVQSNPLAADYFVAACASGEVCSSGHICDTDADNDGLSDGDDLCPSDPLNRCAGPVAIDANTGNDIRLNANTGSMSCSGNKVDCNGDTWLGDFGYNVAATAFECSLAGGCPVDTTSIFGCTDSQSEDIFQCEHWSAATDAELKYDFAVPIGRYVVNVLLMNGFAGTELPGTRLFDIRINGATAHSGVDQVVAAGGSGIPVVRSAIVEVTDSNGLSIEFGHVLENSAIKGIEVLTIADCEVDLDCDDGNPCTDDVCSVSLCNSSDNTDSCDDSLSCTSGDICGGGVCAGADTCTGNYSCNDVSDVCELPPNVTVQVNVNGPAHTGTDYPGDWSADPGAGGVCTVNAYSTANAISGTVDDVLFQSEMWGNPVVCALDDSGSPLPDGDYTVNLHFAEIYFGAGCPGNGGDGSRVMDVNLEGSSVETGIDLHSEGECAASTTLTTGSPVSRSYNVTVSDGTLDISIPGTTNNGKISAIEVLGPPQCSSDPDCDDGNACTDDVCNVDTCEYTDNTASCEDGDLCTTGDTCSAGACVAGGPLSCDDGDVCNGGETCDSGLGCQAGTPLSCDDSNICTGAETCDAILGCQAGTPLNCDDSNVCTGTETCDAALGCQAGTPLSCDDSNVCNGNESCDMVIGCQAGPDLDCDDLDPCTADSCDQVTGCAHDPIAFCATDVPSSEPWGLMLLALLLGSSGFLLLWRRVMPG
jgi:hypothetical protein